MRKIIYTKPFRMADDLPTRVSDTIRVTEDNGKVTKVEKLIGVNYQDVTPESSYQVVNNIIDGWANNPNNPEYPHKYF